VSPVSRRQMDGRTFDSRGEMLRYAQLKILRKEERILFFLEQVPIRLPGNTRYRIDFLIFWADGTVTFEDVKGQRTDIYKIKKRQVEELYAPLVITETRPPKG